jgi:hypothetical protein
MGASWLSVGEFEIVLHFLFKVTSVALFYSMNENISLFVIKQDGSK